MDKETAKQILENHLPDMEFVQSADSASADSARPDSQTGPSLAELRRKFLGDDIADDQDAADITHDDDEVVVGQVRSKTVGPNPADAPEGSKRTVILSKKGIIGSQG